MSLMALKRGGVVQNFFSLAGVVKTLTVNCPLNTFHRTMASAVVTSTSEEDTSFPQAQRLAQTAEEYAREHPDKPVLALPEKSAASEGLSEKKAPTRTIEVGGERVLLDHLGPVILNEDGTMSRITNWDEMGEGEKSTTLRVIGKRNKLRRERLLLAAKEEELTKDPSLKANEEQL